jgi:hypothetical protein
MIERISLQLINESGDAIEVKQSGRKLESKIDVTIAELFSQICFSNNDIEDEEIKNAEKFRLALNLKEYLEDIKRNAN